MKVFLSATSLSPAYGGPAYSVSQLAEALARRGVCVGLWSADQSVATTPLLSGDSGLRRLIGSAIEALEGFGPVDLIHDNGVWMPHNHRLAALAVARSVPRIVSTRGMLEPWAMNHKRLKKAVAWRAYQARDLRRAGRLHATAEAEAAHLERLALGVPVSTIPNGVELAPPRPAWAAGPTDHPRVALFLGRLSPVKGLPMLVDAWSRVRPAGWRLEIAGPDEAGYRREVERAIDAAGLRAVVSLSGPLERQAKTSALHAAELLVLPSHSESFGMVVAEGLAHGLPVLTTTAVPWPGLAMSGCGWRVEPTTQALADGLRVAVGSSPEELWAMGQKGREMIAQNYAWPRLADRFVEAYQQLCAA